MIPKSVTLNKNKKSIQLEYPNNTFLLLTSSYLRACSPSAENKGKLRKTDISEMKEVFNSVMINKVEAVGNYAIRIIFDDFSCVILALVMGINTTIVSFGLDSKRIVPHLFGTCFLFHFKMLVA